ncbi:hypothetical protein VTO42DRAFT_2496 [Malbranchea cinnamomea]
MATSLIPTVRLLNLPFNLRSARHVLDHKATRESAQAELKKRFLSISLATQRRSIHSTLRPSLPPSSSPPVRCRKTLSIPISAPRRPQSIQRLTFSTSSQRPFFSWLTGKNKKKAETNEPQQPYTSPYKAKRKWPPDMSSLSEKQQFRLERKYRRRAKLKYARPTWTKWTKLVQWGLIGFVIVYSVLFMEMKDGGPNPFEGLRNYLRKSFSESVWSTPPQRLRKDIPETADNSPTNKP